MKETTLWDDPWVRDWSMAQSHHGVGLCLHLRLHLHLHLHLRWYLLGTIQSRSLGPVAAPG
jgi:hypothetical protein